MMVELLLYLVVAALSFFAGYQVCNHWHRSMIGEILKRAGVDEETLRKVVSDVRSDLPQDHEDALPRVKVKIEQHSGILYAYRSDNDEFLGQGTDKEDLVKSITEKTKANFIMVVDQESGGELLHKSHK